MTKTIKEQFKNSQGINPIEEIIKKYEIDMSIWYVDSFKIKDGKWNTSASKRDQELTWTKDINQKGDPIQIMEGYAKRFPEMLISENKTYSVEVTFKRVPMEENILESFKEMIKTNIQTREPIRWPKFKVTEGIAGEIATYDAHLAKLAWEKETGYRNYDLTIAVKDYKYVTEKNLDLMSPFKPEIIFYVIGQDMYHVDNMEGKTTSGQHSMDVDGRITKVHEKAFFISRSNILRCRKLAPKVRIIWIPGNHDYLASYMLVFALKEHFRNEPSIEFDLGENPRKAVLWGNLLVGWTHSILGKYNTWGNELAQAFPGMWGQSKFREWHHGDQHKKQNIKAVPVFTSGGVLCRQITALSPVDRWHHVNVFTDAVPGGESFLWSKEEGVFANFMSWTGQYGLNRDNLLKK